MSDDPTIDRRDFLRGAGGVLAGLLGINGGGVVAVGGEQAVNAVKTLMPEAETLLANMGVIREFFRKTLTGGLGHFFRILPYENMDDFKGDRQEFLRTQAAALLQQCREKAEAFFSEIPGILAASRNIQTQCARLGIDIDDLLEKNERAFEMEVASVNPDPAVGKQAENERNTLVKNIKEALTAAGLQGLNLNTLSPPMVRVERGVKKNLLKLAELNPDTVSEIVRKEFNRAVKLFTGQLEKLGLPLEEVEMLKSQMHRAINDAKLQYFPGPPIKPTVYISDDRSYLDYLRMPKEEQARYTPEPGTNTDINYISPRAFERER